MLNSFLLSWLEDGHDWRGPLFVKSSSQTAYSYKQLDAFSRESTVLWKRPSRFCSLGDWKLVSNVSHCQTLFVETDLPEVSVHDLHVRGLFLPGLNRCQNLLFSWTSMHNGFIFSFCVLGTLSEIALQNTRVNPFWILVRSLGGSLVLFAFLLDRKKTHHSSV